MTILAAVKSGLSELYFYYFTNSERLFPDVYTASIAAELVPAFTSSKDDALKVKKFIFCSVLTFVKALPAYVGLTKVVGSLKL
jgi:hypothetical protein